MFKVECVHLVLQQKQDFMKVDEIFIHILDPPHLLAVGIPMLIVDHLLANCLDGAFKINMQDNFQQLSHRVICIVHLFE